MDTIERRHLTLLREKKPLRTHKHSSSCADSAVAPSSVKL